MLLSLLYSSHCLLLTGVHQDPGVFASVLERGADQVSRPYAPPQRGKYGQRWSGVNKKPKKSPNCPAWILGIFKTLWQGESECLLVFLILSVGLPEHFLCSNLLNFTKSWTSWTFFCVANCLISPSLRDKGRFCSTVKICMGRYNPPVPWLFATPISVKWENLEYRLAGLNSRLV